MPKDFEPDNGTVSRAIATCPVCGSAIDDDDTRRLFARKQSAERMVAVVLNKEGTSGKIYRPATDQDILLFKKAEARLVEDRKSLSEEWGVDPVPDEPLPPAGTLGFRIQRYDMSSWGDLFNSRQKLAMITFVSTIRRAHNLMLSEGMEKEYAKAVTEYLALTFDKVADLNNCLCQWEADVESPRHLFVRQAIPITWDYAEANPVSGLTGSWQSMLRRTIGALQSIDFATGPATVGQSSATSLPQQEGFFDAVLTDPPYYDNVPYSYLSDFFYVWLKRIVGELEPELFATPLTPKEDEIVAYSNRGSGPDGGKVFFEEMLKRSFKEIARVLKPNGISVIVYAHKSTAGWETLVNALLDSGLVVTGAWPIHTEMGARLRAQESAALASSIYIVARKTERLPLGLYKDVREELRTFLDARMEQLWRDGISGADFLVSAIGSSVQVYGKYAKVIKEDKAVRADVFLDDVRRIVTDYALRQVLHNGFASEISNLTRFYLLWRWAYGESPAVFDDARKLAQGSGIDLVSEWDRGFIRKDREMVIVLGPNQRRLPDIESLDKKDMIDVLHMALLLWEKGDRDALVDLLKETGYGSKDAFYRVAQAIAETLPKGAKEKLLLDGFVPARDRLGDEIRKGGSQSRLFE